MTSAGLQPFCKKYDINIDFFDGTRIKHRNTTLRKLFLFIYNNHFCLMWKSTNNSFTQAVEEIKINFKVVDNVISDKHVKSFFKYEYKLKKVQSSLTKMNIYVFETYNNDRAVTFCIC